MKTDGLLVNSRWKMSIKLTPKEKFSFEVEKIACMPDMTFMEAVIVQAGLAEIDIEKVSPLLTSRIKKKIREEAERLNMLKK